MNCTGTYDRTIFYNPANKYCIISVKTSDRTIPENARSPVRNKDHLIRFIAVGYELPRTDAVELSLEGEWVLNKKYGYQLQVEQWQEIVPKTRSGVEGYLSSGLIKGIGPKMASDIVARFGVGVIDILEQQPERLLEIRGITENKLEDIKTSYAESRMLRDLMTLLAPYKLTPKTALKIYQHFGPASMEILENDPFELCQISGFGFRRVDSIRQKSGGDLHDPLRIKGALLCVLDEAKRKNGHLFLLKKDQIKAALCLLNEKILLPGQRIREQQVADMLQELILSGTVVSMKEHIYKPNIFAMEDETARQIALRLLDRTPCPNMDSILEQVKARFGLTLSVKQSKGVQQACVYNLSIITGPPGSGKTSAIRAIIEMFRILNPKGKIMLMAPTGRASRRMVESTGFEEASTLHSGLSVISEEDENCRKREPEALEADLIIVDEVSLVDMWLMCQFFKRIKRDTKIVFVGDVDQLPSVGAGNVLYEMIHCGLIPVTVLDEIFRQDKDSHIPHNARLINKGCTKLHDSGDFTFIPSVNQVKAAELIVEGYCQEILENGIEQVQILSPFREDGAASVTHLNAVIRERVNPFCSTEDEIHAGAISFRVGDRIMQTKNTEHVSNGDLGFIRYVKDTPEGTRIGMDFGAGRELEYGIEDLSHVELSYATTVHKAMGSEFSIVLIPVLEAHKIMLYRNLLYTAVTRAKTKVILIGQKSALLTAIHRDGNKKRNTLLGYRIRLYYRAFAKRAGLPIPADLEELELKNAG